MKTFLFSFFFLLLQTSAFAQTRILELKSDKSVYSAGEAAVLRANFFSKPDNTDFQFDIISTVNGEPVEVDRVTDFQMFSSVKNLLPGNYTWEVSVVVQDARYARDLKETIIYYTDSIANLDAQIAIETDPVALASLQNRRDDAMRLKAAALSELNGIRTAILAPLTLQFSVQ